MKSKVIFILCLVQLTKTAPTTDSSKETGASFGTASTIVSSKANSQSSYDRGIHDKSPSGRASYDDHASKAFIDRGTNAGNKVSYDQLAGNFHNQGHPSGSFGQSPFDFSKQFQQISSTFSFPVFPSFPENSSPAGPTVTENSGQQKQSSSSEAQGSWSHNQGDSSQNSSGNKETFSDKDSFGKDVQGGTFADQNAQRYEGGQQSHAGSTLSGSVIPVTLNSTPEGISPIVNEPSSVSHLEPALQAGLSDVPFASIRGERFSKGSNESSQTSGTNSMAYNRGHNNSKSFSHKESTRDQKKFGDADQTSHAFANQQGSNSEHLSGSKFAETSKETKASSQG